jgi:hypothetical protein
MKEMSEQEQNLKETKKDLLNIENGFEANPQIKLLIKSMTGIFLFLNIATLFLCIGLLIQGYLTNHITYEKSILRKLDIDFNIREIYYLYFRSISYSFLSAVYLTSLIKKWQFNRKFNTTIYIFLSSTIILLYSFVRVINLTIFSISWETFFLEDIFVFTFIFAGFIGCFVKRASNNSINHVFEFISFIVFELIAMTN